MIKQPRGPRTSTSPNGSRAKAGAKKPGRKPGQRNWDKYEPSREIKEKMLSAYAPIDPATEAEGALMVLERNMTLHAVLGNRLLQLALDLQDDPVVDRKEILWVMEAAYRHREMAGRTAAVVLPYRHARILPVTARPEDDESDTIQHGPHTDPVVIEDIGRTLERVKRRK